MKTRQEKQKKQKNEKEKGTGNQEERESGQTPVLVGMWDVGCFSGRNEEGTDRPAQANNMQPLAHRGRYDWLIQATHCACADMDTNTSTNYGAGAMGNMQTDAGRCREGAEKRGKEGKSVPRRPPSPTHRLPTHDPWVGRPGQSSCSVCCCCSTGLRPISAAFSHSQRKKPAQHHFRGTEGRVQRTAAWRWEGFDCVQYHPHTCSHRRCRRQRYQQGG